MVFSSQICSRVKQEIDRIIDSYGIFFGNEFLNMLEELSNCHFINLAQYFPTIESTDKQQGYRRIYTLLNGPHELLREDVHILLRILQEVNKVIETPITIHADFYRDDVAPRWGVNRINVDLD